MSMRAQAIKENETMPWKPTEDKEPQHSSPQPEVGFYEYTRQFDFVLCHRRKADRRNGGRWMGLHGSA